MTNPRKYQNTDTGAIRVDLTKIITIKKRKKENSVWRHTTTVLSLQAAFRGWLVIVDNIVAMNEKNKNKNHARTTNNGNGEVARVLKKLCKDARSPKRIDNEKITSNIIDLI